jgi:hypothetical protein
MPRQWGGPLTQENSCTSRLDCSSICKGDAGAPVSLKSDLRVWKSFICAATDSEARAVENQESAERRLFSVLGALLNGLEAFVGAGSNDAALHELHSLPKLASSIERRSP